MKKIAFAFIIATAYTSASAQVLDFEGFAAGTVMTDQYAGIGVNISAMNFTGPNKAIIFDSANPTGGDSDLASPGYHATNTTPLGNILIIAENDTDSNDDGFVDNPDDEGSRPAGWIRFDMDTFATAGSITLLDIEESGGSIEFFSSLTTTPTSTIGISATGDNSVQTISFDGFAFDSARVNLAGSGAIASFEAVPEPATLIALSSGVALLLRRRRKTA